MNTSSKRIRVRFAPSPTGSLHIGGLRTALYNYLFAKKLNGDFILRIEDTDQQRLVPGAVEQLLRTLKIFDLQPDEGLQLSSKNTVEAYGPYGPYIQSQRLSTYRKYAEKLLSIQAAYRCFCSEERLKKLRELQQQKKQHTKYDGHCKNLSKTEVQNLLTEKKPFVIRLLIPTNRIIIFNDIVRGKVSFSTDLVDDQVLVKSDGFPTYHLANVVDDHEMQISHIIRGEEWLSSVPKHLLLYEAFGWAPPLMAHLPNLLNEHRAKLSKRMGSVSCEDYLKKGFLPQAILNYLLLLGWNPKTDQEVFSRKEMVETFALDQVHMSGAIVDEKKLAWMNGLYIQQSTPEEILDYAIKYGFINTSLKQSMKGESWNTFFMLVQKRLSSLLSLQDDISYFFKDPVANYSLLLNKGALKENVHMILCGVTEIISSHQERSKNSLMEEIEKFIIDSDLQRGDVLWPIRVAITGRTYSPGAYELLSVFKQEIIVRRLNNAIASLKKDSDS